MKFIQTPLFICAMVIAAAACKKDHDNSDCRDLEGTWELRKASGNTPVIAFGPGNGNALNFTSNSYVKYQNGQVTKSGIYSVKEDETVQEGTCLVLDPKDYNRIIVFDGKADTTKQYFKVDGNTLHIASGCHASDAGHIEEYERIKN